MVGGVTEKPLIPLVELVKHYPEFKSRRTGGVLVRAPYRRQEARIQLAERYLDDPTELTDKFFRSVDAFGCYANVRESLIGAKRTNPAEVASIDDITSGPKAAAYLGRTLASRKLTVGGLGKYAYVDREIVPARTTSGKLATMANRFDDEAKSRSTRAIKADLLLRSLPDGRPTVGEVKVSTARGDDADPVYGLVQALALASQLASESQRSRLRMHYQAAGYARNATARRARPPFPHRREHGREDPPRSSSSTLPPSSVRSSIGAASVHTSNESPSSRSRPQTASFISRRKSLGSASLRCKTAHLSGVCATP